MEKRLNGDEKELFEKIMDLLPKDCIYYAVGRFAYGFRLRARFTAESLLDTSGFIKGEEP